MVQLFERLSNPVVQPVFERLSSAVVQLLKWLSTPVVQLFARFSMQWSIQLSIPVVQLLEQPSSAVLQLFEQLSSPAGQAGQ